MQIKLNGTEPTTIGPDDNFTGHAITESIRNAEGASRIVVGEATFNPGARTVWHVHPVGQLLVITAGCGRVGTWDGPVKEVKAGDSVWFEANEKHWHGAGLTTSMTHLAVTEAEDGWKVKWLEPVTDAQFEGR